MAENDRRYGGDLICIPLSSLKTHGRGDDVFVVIDHEYDSKYGVLGIGNNARDYRMAQKMALEAENLKKGPMLIAVEDDESGSPMVLTHEMIYGGKKHYLAVVFNASFADDPRESSDGSFCLRLSSRLDPKKGEEPSLDPKGKFSERIRFSPGENIDWRNEQERFLIDMLEREDED